MLFSVIVPVYNASKYLRDSLNSMLDQSFQDWECICVDDGSTDESLAILKEYASKDERFKIIHQSNAGVSEARNIALDAAVGEWILFLDSDDAYAVNALSIIDKVISAFKLDLLMFDYRSVQSVGDFFAETSCPQNYDLFRAGDAKEAYKSIALLFAWNMCYRSSLIKNMRFEPLTVGEDALFGFVAFTRARHFSKIGSVLYQYRQHTDSAIHTTTLKNVISGIDSYLLLMKSTYNWQQYKTVEALVFKRFKSSYCGNTYARVLSLGHDERALAIKHFFDEGGRTLEGHWFCRRLLSSHHYMTFFLCYHLVWRIKVMCLKNRLIKRFLRK